MKSYYVPKYCDSNSILLVNSKGFLRKLFCPFRVKCLKSSQNIKAGTMMWVDEVANNSRDELVYWILGKPYLYTDFEIKAVF